MTYEVKKIDLLYDKYRSINIIIIASLCSQGSPASWRRVFREASFSCAAFHL
ncbi:MAG: hypothetical protein ACD_16C00240G0003 [uncultured bacterium]|nr:MAG: hypothetical protein ACD_16C00240G0003 [uncultured bacterium]